MILETEATVRFFTQDVAALQIDRQKKKRKEKKKSNERQKK